MELLQDGVIAFLSAVGLTALVWLIAGAILGFGKCENPEILLVLPLRGDAPAMEEDYRELLRIRSRLPCARIVLTDCGLDAESRELAEYLCLRDDKTELRDGPVLQIE